MGRHRKTWIGRIWRWWTNPYPAPKPTIIKDDEWGNALKEMAARRNGKVVTWQALGKTVLAHSAG